MSAVRPATVEESGGRNGVLVIEAGGEVVASGWIDPAGMATRPGVPAVRVEDRGGGREALQPLIAALLDRAAGPGGETLIGWDPMDAAGLKMLERLGFRPTGEMPYFERGGGHVEYVTGYMDATGAVLDLVHRA